MAASSMATNLAQLIGLDEPTVAQQILPYMTSIKSAHQVSSYLETLLPPGQASQALIQTYLAQRFPSTAASRAQPPQSSSNAAKADPWSTGKPTPAARSTAALAPPNAAAMQSQFASTGRVYIKNRDDLEQGGWGGLGASSSSRSNSFGRAQSGTTTPVPSPMTAPSSSATRPTNPPVHHHVNDMSTSSSSNSAPSTISLSETGRLQLATLDISLKLLRLRPSSSVTTSSKRSCFCSARSHPLSSYSPLCPSCGLILCSLNPPSFPCPSCQQPHLISAPLLDSYITTLETQRSDLLERERRRTQAEKEQEALERAAMRFPELGGEEGRANASSQRMGLGRMGYADLVGGGRAGALDLQARIERGYAEGRTVKGREFGGATAPQKVLRLDMKTNKVKVQTKTNVIKKATPDQKGRGLVEHPEVEEEEEDEWEGSRWIDESDDGGWRMRNGLSTFDEAKNMGAGTGRDARRPFINLTLDEKDRPLWIEPTTIDSEPLPSTTGVDVDLEASTGRRNVPGAAPSKPLEGKKNKRNRKAKTEEATSSSVVGA